MEIKLSQHWRRMSRGTRESQKCQSTGARPPFGEQEVPIRSGSVEIFNTTVATGEGRLAQGSDWRGQGRAAQMDQHQGWWGADGTGELRRASPERIRTAAGRRISDGSRYIRM
jgi:hypothetical protein